MVADNGLPASAIMTDGSMYGSHPMMNPIVVISIPPKIRRANGHYFPVRLIIMMLLCFYDDGKVYLFYGTGQLRQLKSDLSDVEPGGIDQKIFERDADEQGLLEGSQAFQA